MNAHFLKTTFHTSVSGHALLAVSVLLLTVGWLLWPSGQAQAQASSDATLKGLVISYGPLNFRPDLPHPPVGSGATRLPLNFDPDTTAYAVSVLPAAARVTVTPSASHPMATTTVNGADPATPVVLDYGANTIRVVVTAEDTQTTKTYVITVTRPVNRGDKVQIAASINPWTRTLGDVEIMGLALPAGVTISPAFQSDKYSYTLTVPADRRQLGFAGFFTLPPYEPPVHGQGWGVLAVGTPAQLDPETVTRIGDYVIANGGSYFIHKTDATFTLSPVSTTTAVMRVYKWMPQAWRIGHIHTQGLSVWKDYTLAMTQEPPSDDDATLYDLTISRGALSFDRGTTSYAVYVARDVESVVLTPTTLHPMATSTVNGADPSTAVSLDEGENVIPIVVTAADGMATQTYRVTVNRGGNPYSALIAQMYQWRNRPDARQYGKPHTDRWDRALLAFGETVADASITPMTAAEAQALADQKWGFRWAPVAAALRELEAARQPPQQSPQQQGQESPPQRQQVNRAPTVAAPLSDVSDLEVEATREVSLSGVFDDADGDALTVNATSSDATVATVTVASDYSKLTVTGVAVGAATIAVAADDGSDNDRAIDSFDVYVVKKYTSLIAQMYEWRNGPEAQQYGKPHTDRWDRALLAFGEIVADTTITPMTAAEAQALADQAWGTRWVPVAAALKELESAAQQPVQQQQPQQQPPQQQQVNRAPTVAAAIADATIVNRSGTRTVSLSGVFADADNDALSITAASSDEAVATVTVAPDYSALTVSAQARGTATITVTASDGSGGTVSDSFTVRVKATPTVATALADVSGLEAGTTRDVSLTGVFDDADGDALTISAGSDDANVATATVAADYSSVTVAGVSEGTATITVVARDSDGNRVSDTFEVSVAKAPEPTPTPEPEPTPTPEPTREPDTPETEISGVVARYDANGNGRIDASEYRQALSDYNAGKITYAEMLEVILATFRGG